jgi:peptidoglycan/xylan/chitin deacetylase (PgdA/CDA1 family)
MLPILMYHGLHGDPRARGHYDGVYSVRPQDFARQLDWLQQQGYRTLRLDDALRDASAIGMRAVVISFDDGDVSNTEVALPLLQARGMVAEFFITSGMIGQPGRLDADGVRDLAAAGMGVGAHGRSHALLEDLDAAGLDAELRDSKQALQDILGREVDALALPGGRGGTRERDAALALGYRSLLGSVPGPNRVPCRGAWLQRLAVTRDLRPDAFAALVQWRGLSPRIALARHQALAWPKRLLGNQRYELLRARWLNSGLPRTRVP